MSMNERDPGQLYKKLISDGVLEARYSDMPEDQVEFYVANRDRMRFDPALPEEELLKDIQAQWQYDQFSESVELAKDEGVINKAQAKLLTRDHRYKSARAADVPIFSDEFDFEAAVGVTRKRGYFFAEDALSEGTLKRLAVEADHVPFVLGDHTTTPINRGRPNEVKQRHERYYAPYDAQGAHQLVYEANTVIQGLVGLVKGFKSYAALRKSWHPNEIGYQRYRSSDDFIDVHRDRSSDRLLSVTFTITGSSLVRIFKTLGAPDDYKNIEQTDEFRTHPGSVMMLRAPGFGSNEQTVHQVLPPEEGSRSILNLRMRPSVLPQPRASR